MSFSETSMLEGKVCAQLFELVKDYLGKLSCCGRFLDDLRAGEEESFDFLSTSCSLLKELGRLGGISENTEGIFSEFKKAIEKGKNQSINLSNIFEKPYSGSREWVDEVNYIYIWVLNSYGLDLKSSSINEVKKKFGSHQEEIELEAESKEKKSRTTSKRSNRSKNWTGLSIYRNIFKVNNLRDLDEDESFAYIVSKTQAMERLEREIRSGRVYIYLSKPFRNPILKKYFSYLCLVGIAFSGAAFLKAAVGSGADKTNPILFAIMSFIFFLLSWRENNRGWENENFKYCFSRRIFFYYFFLSSFFLVSMLDSQGQNNGGYYAIFSKSGDITHTVLFALLVSVVVISVTFFLVGFFFLNPKKNKELIERLLNKYSSPPYFNN